MIIQLKLDDMRGVIPPISPSNGCFVAGGAVRRWFGSKEELSDVDVFAPSHDHIAAFVAANKELKQVDDHKNAMTFDFNGVRVQTMKIYRPNLTELFDNFDYNVCQFGWTEEGIFATQEAVIGVLRGHLSVALISKDFAVDSLRRAFKYHSKGFIPCNGTIRDIANSLSGLTPEQVQSQVELSPHGGKWIVRFD